MRICILLLSSFGTCLIGKTQHNDVDKSRQVNMMYVPDYYKEKGIVFSADYAVGIDMSNLRTRYTPTKEDIIKAEKIFTDKYSDIEKVKVDTKTNFCNWVRQYIGLIDTNGDKNIIIQFVDNTKPRKINRLLGKNWETAFVVMLSDNFYAVSKRLKINIDTGELSYQL